METTKQLYQAAKAASGAKSDYEFAKVLGVTRAAVSKYVNGKSTFDDAHAATIAGILDREPGEVAALCAAERSKDAKTRSMWLRVAAVLAAIGLPPAHGAGFDHNTPNPAKNKAQTDNYAQWRAALAWLIFGDWLHLA